MMFDTDGLELHFDLIGEGEPLLWLHGFMGAGSDWRYVFQEPPDGFQLIAPDLRGHGGSTNPSGCFLFRDAARDVGALLRHLGVPRLKAIGVSGGGIALLHIASAAPDSVSSMVIVSAPPYVPAEARAIQRQMSRSMLTDEELALMRQRHRGGEAQISDLIAQARAFADSYDDVNFTAPYLRTITAETLIVFGDRDPFYPVSLAFELRAAIPLASLGDAGRGARAGVRGARREVRGGRAGVRPPTGGRCQRGRATLMCDAASSFGADLRSAGIVHSRVIASSAV